MRADVVPAGILADDAAARFPLARVLEIAPTLFRTPKGSRVRNGGKRGETDLKRGTQMTQYSRCSSAQGTHTVNQLLQTLQRLYAGEYNGPLRRNSRDTTDA
jgi:hypothetical protein